MAEGFRHARVLVQRRFAGVLEETDSGDAATGWHKSCVRKFFGVSELPQLELTDEQMELLTQKTVAKGLTVPGVQKKLSLHLSTADGARLTLVDYPTRFILKPQSEEFPYLPEAEALVMRMAQKSGIRTVPFALLSMNDNEYAYITRRIDRRISDKADSLDGAELLAMEDFCQLAWRVTADKYRSSYERCTKIIKTHSWQAGLDLSEFFLRLVFCFATGNSDMHLKNFSLIETEPASRAFVLSAAYDLLPVNLILPEDSDETAMPLCGKKRNLRQKDFLDFAETSGIPARAAERMIEKIISIEPLYREECDASYLPDEWKGRMKVLIQERIARLRESSA